jgi:hypothetical protein
VTVVVAFAESKGAVPSEKVLILLLCRSPVTQRLGSSVDHFVGDPVVLGPVGNEPPPEQHGPSFAVLACPYREHLLTGRDVVTLRNRLGHGGLEALGERLAPHGAGEAAAHGAKTVEACSDGDTRGVHPS